MTNAFVRRINDFVKFPNENNSGRIKEGFYETRHFPGVIGCLDGTHVWITAPHICEVDYVNRKGYHSINVQVICDHLGKWINIVAKWPGSTHDSRILKNSQIWNIMESGSTTGFLLGDSGYPCRRWLMTPLLTPSTPQERHYNAAHKETRVKVEQAIGRWKRRFHILHLESRMRNPESICKVIAATAVLHNIAIDRNEVQVEDLPPSQLQPSLQEYSGDSSGAMARRQLISDCF